MPSAKSPRIRLQHILTEIDGIQGETGSLQFEAVAAHYGLIRIVERGLQIISEAAKALPPDVRALEPDIPWKDIIGIGNFLRHEYYRIKESDIKSILENDLPALRLAVLRLLEQIKE
jgi:uncharacterized protein with HEPN domain